MKNILIVGNGLISRDLNLAHRVDETEEFDLVIRMNECNLLPYHDRIGWRTDIYIFFGRPLMTDMYRNSKEIWWPWNELTMKKLLSKDNPKNIIAGYELLKKEGIKHNHTYETNIRLRKKYLQKYKNLKEKLGSPKSLSGGIAAILMCELFLSFDYKINIVGYDGGKSGHIWDERETRGLCELAPCPKCDYSPPPKHFFDKEYDWLLEQEKLGVINIIKNELSKRKS